MCPNHPVLGSEVLSDIDTRKEEEAVAIVRAVLGTGFIVVRGAGIVGGVHGGVDPLAGEFGVEELEGVIEVGAGAGEVAVEELGTGTRGEEEDAGAGNLGGVGWKSGQE
jgi:hypothetical protein